jgi:hypothetical protein
MNNPGIRYYHLWDDNPNIDGTPNRVGKVFPDAKIIIIDDEELIAAMSYKSNRNWTLPAPRLSLITPNTCGTDNNSVVGILTGESETLYVTYRLTNTSIFTNSLHNNYYSSIQGPNLCLPFSSQNVGVRFGGEFNCLNEIPSVTTTTTFNPVTTTTTFNPEVCGTCYQITVPKGQVDLFYTDYVEYFGECKQGVCPQPVFKNNRTVRPGYNTPICTPEKYDMITCKFADVLYKIALEKRYGITNCCPDEVEIWLEKNGAPVANSATRLAQQGNNEKGVAAWNWLDNATTANTYYQIAWASTDANMQITAIDSANTLSGVAVPSVIVTVVPVGA